MPRVVSHRGRAASDARTPEYAGPVPLVDDGPGFLDSLTLLLESRGLRLLTARDGAHGLHVSSAFTGGPGHGHHDAGRGWYWGDAVNAPRTTGRGTDALIEALEEMLKR